MSKPVQENVSKLDWKRRANLSRPTASYIVHLKIVYRRSSIAAAAAALKLSSEQQALHIKLSKLLCGWPRLKEGAAPAETDFDERRFPSEFLPLPCTIRQSLPLHRRSIQATTRDTPVHATWCWQLTIPLISLSHHNRTASCRTL